MSRAKQITIIVVIALLILGLIVAVIYSVTRRQKMVCTGFEVKVEGTDGNLLSVQDVTQFIGNRNLDPKGILCASVDLDRLERELLTMPLVGSAECCFLSNGTLQVKVSERHPLFRVRTHVSDYCIDTKGRQMLTPKNLPDTIISVTGDVTVEYAMTQIYPLVCFLYTQPRLASEFRQISVGRGNQVSLRSKRYSYLVIIGSPERHEQCFEKLARFREWDSKNEYQDLYQSIDLQFRGQIVCKKKP